MPLILIHYKKTLFKQIFYKLVKTLTAINYFPKNTVFFNTKHLTKLVIYHLEIQVYLPIFDKI